VTSRYFNNGEGYWVQFWDQITPVEEVMRGLDGCYGCRPRDERPEGVAS
jgi:hypothetical protein